MKIGANKAPVEVIKKGAFKGTHFWEVYSDVIGKWHRKSWKEFYVLKNIGGKYYSSSYYDVRVDKYGVKGGTSLTLRPRNMYNYVFRGFLIF